MWPRIAKATLTAGGQTYGARVTQVFGGCASKIRHIGVESR